MNLQLHLSTAAALPGEPLPAKATLTSGAEPLRLPVLPDESAALVVTVRTPAGELVALANGHDRVRRKGFGGEPMASMPTDELPPHETGQLQFDLLEFIDIPKAGDYLVSVAIQFEAINIESERVPLRILDSPACDVDTLTGRVCVPCMYSAVTHKQDESNRAIIRISNGLNPQAVLARIVAEVPEGASPRLSVSDFTNSDDIEGDLTRWLGWVQGGDLDLIRFRADEPAGKVNKPTLRFKARSLIGRPIQHADGGVTAFLAEDAGNRTHAVRCDPTGVVVGDTVICAGTSIPHPAVIGAHSDGSVEVCMAADSWFPLTLVQIRAGKTRTMVVEVPLDAVDRTDDARVLALRLFDGATPNEAGAIGAAFVLGTRPSTIWVLRAPYAHFSEGGKHDTAPVVIPPPEPRAAIRADAVHMNLPRLDEGETITSVDLAQSTAVPPPSDASWVLFVTAKTSAGRIFSGLVGGNLELMEQADRQSRVNPSLVTAQDGSVFLGLATMARGFELVRIHEPPTY